MYSQILLLETQIHLYDEREDKSLDYLCLNY